MSKVAQAAAALAALGLPSAQQNERSALTLLALANLSANASWSKAEAKLLRTVDIMSFIREQYGKNYKANTRETIRRQTLHQFEQARVVDRNPDDPTRPTNSGKNAYQLTDAALEVVRAVGTAAFEDRAREFLAQHGSLAAAYSKVRKANLIPLHLPDGSTVHLSPGYHNVLQVAIIEQFGPRFAPDAEVLYVGDTAKKHVVLAEDRLRALQVPITEHDKLPDVVLYLPSKNWLFLIEAVTTHGPVSPKRHAELEAVLAECSAARVYVTAFLNTSDFKQYLPDIAWETEVWIADKPDHMVHFNGPKFLGPYDPPKRDEGSAR